MGKGKNDPSCNQDLAMNSLLGSSIAKPSPGLLPLAYLIKLSATRSESVCETCAVKHSGGSIDSYNQARGFDWVGEWIDPPDYQANPTKKESGESWAEAGDRHLKKYQENKGLLSGEPLYVLFGDGASIDQVRSEAESYEDDMQHGEDNWEELDELAESLGLPSYDSRSEVEAEPGPNVKEIECAQCGTTCITVDDDQFYQAQQ